LFQYVIAPIAPIDNEVPSSTAMNLLRSVRPIWPVDGADRNVAPSRILTEEE
jgi:hypothetical protein